MATGVDKQHVWPWLAAAVCGLACSEIVGQLHGTQKAEVLWVVLAVAFLLYAAWPRLAPAVSDPAPNISCSKLLASPCFKPCHDGTGNSLAFPDINNTGCSSPSDMTVQKRNSTENRIKQHHGFSWVSFQCALCCVQPNDRDADDIAPQPKEVVHPMPASPASSPSGSPSMDSETARHAAEQLRLRLADIIGPQVPVSTSRGRQTIDEVAVTAMKRYGGEWSCIARFLRARKFDVVAAEKMFRNTVEFRRLTGANGITDDPQARKVWSTVRPCFAAAPLMFTDTGNVVIYFRMADFLRIWQRGISEEHLRIFYISWMERALALQAKGRSLSGVGEEGEMPACIEVYDLQGIGLSHARCLPGVRVMMRILRIGQDHYPENLHTAIMLNVPALACRPLQMVQSVLDVRTQAKLRFVRDSGHSLLREILKVSPEELVRLFHTVAANGFLKESAL